MKIAFISYDYPPAKDGGGIATYVSQCARILVERGHHVEVFTGQPSSEISCVEEGVTIHRLGFARDATYSKNIGLFFKERHGIVQFDVLEGPELEAEAKGAVQCVPDIALVIKLHSSNRILWEASNPIIKPPGLIERARESVHARLSGFKPYWAGNAYLRQIPDGIIEQDTIERNHALDADAVVAPCQAMADRVTTMWEIDESFIQVVPYPYIPSSEMSSIPIDTDTSTVTFMGHLSVRKGVIELARAIPEVLRAFPSARFRFVGGSRESTVIGDIKTYVSGYLLRKHSQSVQYDGEIPLRQIPKILSETDICVIPSIWENFPNVCLEAMAAGRGIVATSSGGMKEMLRDGKFGLLIPPLDSERLAAAIIELLSNPDRRKKLGQAAREHVAGSYSADQIGPLLEQSYESAIRHRTGLGPRTT